MKECEEFVKEHIGKIRGLEEAIKNSRPVVEIWGYPIAQFDAIKILIGNSYIMGVVVRVTKQTIAFIDGKSRLHMYRVSKINGIEIIDCEDFIRHKDSYRAKFGHGGLR